MPGDPISVKIRVSAQSSKSEISSFLLLTKAHDRCFLRGRLIFITPVKSNIYVCIYC